jgi:hypothetical protein
MLTFSKAKGKLLEERMHFETRKVFNSIFVLGSVDN